MRRFAATFALAMALVGAAAPTASAALQPSDPPPLEGFVPAADQDAQEQLPAAPLVLTAYAFAWVAVLFYVWLTWTRLGKVEGELRDLGKKMKN